MSRPGKFNNNNSNPTGFKQGRGGNRGGATRASNQQGPHKQQHRQQQQQSQQLQQPQQQQTQHQPHMHLQQNFQQQQAFHQTLQPPTFVAPFSNQGLQPVQNHPPSGFGSMDNEILGLAPPPHLVGLPNTRGLNSPSHVASKGSSMNQSNQTGPIGLTPANSINQIGQIGHMGHIPPHTFNTQILQKNANVPLNNSLSQSANKAGPKNASPRIGSGTTSAPNESTNAGSGARVASPARLSAAPASSTSMTDAEKKDELRRRLVQQKAEQKRLAELRAVNASSQPSISPITSTVTPTNVSVAATAPAVSTVPTVPPAFANPVVTASVRVSTTSGSTASSVPASTAGSAPASTPQHLRRSVPSNPMSGTSAKTQFQPSNNLLKKALDSSLQPARELAKYSSSTKHAETGRTAGVTPMVSTPTLTPAPAPTPAPTSTSAPTSRTTTSTVSASVTAAPAPTTTVSTLKAVSTTDFSSPSSTSLDIQPVSKLKMLSKTAQPFTPSLSSSQKPGEASEKATEISSVRPHRLQKLKVPLITTPSAGASDTSSSSTISVPSSTVSSKSSPLPMTTKTHVDRSFATIAANSVDASTSTTIPVAPISGLRKIRIHSDIAVPNTSSGSATHSGPLSTSTTTAPVPVSSPSPSPNAVSGSLNQSSGPVKRRLIRQLEPVTTTPVTSSYSNQSETSSPAPGSATTSPKTEGLASNATTTTITMAATTPIIATVPLRRLSRVPSNTPSANSSKTTEAQVSSSAPATKKARLIKPVVPLSLPNVEGAPKKLLKDTDESTASASTTSVSTTSVPTAPPVSRIRPMNIISTPTTATTVTSTPISVPNPAAGSQASSSGTQKTARRPKIVTSLPLVTPVSVSTSTTTSSASMSDEVNTSSMNTNTDVMVDEVDLDMISYVPSTIVTSISIPGLDEIEAKGREVDEFIKNTQIYLKSLPQSIERSLRIARDAEQFVKSFQTIFS